MSLTYEQAVALYHQGLDPTVAMLLALDEDNARLRAGGSPPSRHPQPCLSESNHQV